jgi:hypothetical protein
MFDDEETGRRAKTVSAAKPSPASTPAVGREDAMV